MAAVDDEEGSPPRSVVVTLVYISLLLDNILLSAVVPIIPAYLSETSTSHRTGEEGTALDTGPATAQTAQTALFTHLFSNLSRTGDGRVPLRSRTSVIPGYFPSRWPESDQPLTSPSPEQTSALLSATVLPSLSPLSSVSTPSFPPLPSITTFEPSQRPHFKELPKFNEPDVTNKAKPTTGKVEGVPPSSSGAGDRIGVLLSSKAFVQLPTNAVVGAAVGRLGFRLPLVTGTGLLTVSAFLFAVASGATSMLVARAVHGVASSCIAVAGLSTVADLYLNERQRSRVMGRVLGAMAFGVLIGYPFGGLSYDFIGKSPPFWLLTALLIIVTGVEFRQLRPLAVSPLQWHDDDEEEDDSLAWWSLLADRRVVIIAAAVLISTSVMAILEPTLPVWLLQTIHPQKWQLGSVFIPDSLGYLMGTHGFGEVALRLGRWRVAAAAMMTVGAAALLLPQSTRMVHLVLPHFCIGLGIGLVDTALMPLLARLVESRSTRARYGTVYAASQTAVCLAYSVGPFLGGYLTSQIGFAWLLAVLGGLNLLFAPFLVMLREPPPPAHTAHGGRQQELVGLVGCRRPPPIATLAGTEFSYTELLEP